MKQTTMFKTVNGSVTVNNFGSAYGESKTSPATVKLTFSEKKQIQEFCFQNDLSVSEFMRHAASLYLSFFEQASKLNRYRKAVVSMLDNLP